MNSYKFSYLLAGGAFVAVIAESLLYYPLLPEMVATHFNAAGNPDGWGTKSSNLIFELGITIFIGVLLLTVAIVITKLKNANINLPNKEYWLAAERRKQTLQIVAKYLNYLNTLVLLFFFFLFRQISESNMSGYPSLGSSFWFLVIGLIFSNMVIVIRMILVFSNIDKK